MEIKKLLLLISLLLPLPALSQTTIFNCSSNFVNTNTSCGVGGFISGSGSAFVLTGTENGSSPALSSGNVVLVSSSADHVALSLLYQTRVNVQAFTTTMQFIPNDWNFSFTFNNCANNGSSGPGTCGGFALNSFSAGAGGEGGFSQSYNPNPFPYNVFALMTDEFGYIHASDSGFTYSTMQIYQQNQSPMSPSEGGAVIQPYWSTTKFSTSPVALNNPPGTINTTTGDLYSLTLNYDGSNLNACLVNLTLANGTCNATGTSGTGTYFQNTWANVSIPSQVDGTTAYVGVMGSTGVPYAPALQVNQWEYIVNTPTASPSSTVTSAGSPTAPNPTFSPVAGSYSGSQSVTITVPSAPSNSYVCYSIAAAGQTLLPQPNNLGGCGVGTLYSGPVTVSSSNTLYATAGVNNGSCSGLPNCMAGYLPSGYVQGAYTISAGSATAPSCTPTSGSSSSPITVTCTNSNTGTTVMCQTEDGSTPITNGAGMACTHGTLITSTLSISSTVATLKVVAGTSTLSDSTVSTYGAYTISSGTTSSAAGATLRGATIQ